MSFVLRMPAKWCAVGVLCFAVTALVAQEPVAKPMSGEAIKAAAGNAPVDPGPLAKDLNPTMTQPAIESAMRKVADWQLKDAEGKWNQDWTYAPLYLGLLAASRTTGDKRYHDTVLHQSEAFRWKLWANRKFHADDEAIGQAYEALYVEDPKEERIEDVRLTMNALLQRPDDPAKDLWWWCDALFMAPPTMARLAVISSEHGYIDKMNAEWALTQQHLYDPQQRLFARDASFLDKKEANGEKLFWSRGNGWVLAGLANLLRVMPKNEPARSGYERLFKDMASRVAGLQGADGLWRAGLLDAAAYPQAEISGSAFFTYAFAWGMNNGLLDKREFRPVVDRAWKGMLGHVYADGRLGSIQPIGAAPDAVTPSSSYVYGVGAFLLAGSELHELVRSK